MFRILLTLLWWMLASASASASEGPLVSVQAQAAGAVRPGSTVDIAWTFTIAADWHLYWQNPGDSGLPPQVRWTLPTGWTADPLQFPVPQRHEAAGLVSFIFEREVVLLSRLHVPPSAPAGRVAIPARVTWLVCQEACIPGGAEVIVGIDVDPAASAATPTAAWTAAQARLPQTAPTGTQAQAWKAAASGAGKGAGHLRLSGIDLGAEARFFPADAGAFSLAGSAFGKQVQPGLFQVPFAAEAPARLTGVVTGVPGMSGMLIDVPWGSAPVADPSDATAHVGLVTALVAGLLGGLVLNLMPCVLPVLALKLLGFAGHGGDRRRIITAAAGYAAGVVATMLLLALVVLGLRAAGAGVGWGFQLQEPAVVLALTLLFLLVACNLAGLFEVGLAATRLDPRRGGAFANGVLTTLVATPCGAPFASTAFGFALVAPAWEAVLVFLALGVGLAAPVLAVAIFPATARWIPKPGPWMVDFKQLLALPVIGAAGWMIWSFQAVAGAEAAFLVLVLLVPLVLWCAWAWGRWQLGGRSAGLRFAIAVLATAALFGWIITQPRVGVPASASDHAAWQSWSASRQAELLASGSPILIDATAAWCLTCQVNKRTSLHDAQVLADARARGITLLRADFTNRDAALAEELARHGRASVPTYILFDRHGKATVLPDVLTPGILTDAFTAIPPGATP